MYSAGMEWERGRGSDGELTGKMERESRTWS